MSRIYDLKKAPLGHAGDVPVWSEGDVRGWVLDILGRGLDENGCTECPGMATHSTGNGRRDFKVWFTGAVPAAKCVHASCAAVVEDFNRALWKKLFKRENGAVARGFQKRVVVAMKEWDKKARKFDVAALAAVVRPDITVDKAWLRGRSPVDPVGCSTEDWLRGCYGGEERVLVFTHEFSQGDFGWRNQGTGDRGQETGGRGQASGGGWVKLGRDREDKNVAVASGPVAPVAWKNGVWVLNQPVDGKWHYNPTYKDSPWGRRRYDAVAAWRYMVLESDEAPVEMWLNALVQWPLPVVSLVTSGGKSVHALLRVDMGSQAEWNALRDAWQPILTKLGADGKSLSAVRLTRLPGALRKGRMVEVGRDDQGRKILEWRGYEDGPRLQELLWFNPAAGARDLRPMMDLPLVR